MSGVVTGGANAFDASVHVTGKFDGDASGLIAEMGLVKREIEKISNTLNSLKSGSGINKYFAQTEKEVETLLESAAEAYRKYNEAMNQWNPSVKKDAAAEVLKVVNAITALQKLGNSNIPVNLLINGKSPEEIKTEILGIHKELELQFQSGTYSVKEFTEAFDVLGKLGDQGVNIGELSGLLGQRKEAEELTVALKRLQQQLVSVREERDQLQSQLDKTDFSEIKHLREQIAELRGQMSDEFKNFLQGAGFSNSYLYNLQNGYSDGEEISNSIIGYFREIEEGSTTARQAIANFTEEYSQVLSHISGANFVGDSVQHADELSVKVDELNTKLSELSDKITADVHAGITEGLRAGLAQDAELADTTRTTLQQLNSGELKNIYDLLAEIIKASGDAAQGVAGTNNAAIQVLQTMKELSGVDTEKLRAINSAIVSLSSLGKLSVSSTPLKNIASFAASIDSLKNVHNLTAISNLNLDNFKDVKSSKTLTYLSDAFAQIEKADATKITAVADALGNITGSKVSSGFKNLANALDSMANISGKKLEALKDFDFKKVFDLSGQEGAIKIFEGLTASANEYAKSLENLAKQYEAAREIFESITGGGGSGGGRGGGGRGGGGGTGGDGGGGNGPTNPPIDTSDLNAYLQFLRQVDTQLTQTRLTYEKFEKELGGDDQNVARLGENLERLQELRDNLLANGAAGDTTVTGGDRQLFLLLQTAITDTKDALTELNIEMGNTGQNTSGLEAYQAGLRAIAALEKSIGNSVGTWDKTLGTGNQFSSDTEPLLQELHAIQQEMESTGVYSDELRQRVSRVSTAFKQLGTSAADAMRNSNMVPGMQQSIKALSEVEKAIASLDSKMANMGAAKNGKSASNFAALEDARKQYEQLRREIERGTISPARFAEQMQKLNATVSTNAAQIKIAGENTKTWGDRLKEAVSKFSSWLSVSRLIMTAVRSVKQMIQTAIQLDDEMTQLKIVTNASAASMEDYGDRIAASAKRIGASMTDLINSTTTYARLGYSLEESSILAEYTSMLKQVGDIDISTAQNAVTAITKAFSDEIDIENIESVMDRLVKVGKNLPRHTVTYVYVIGYNGQRRTGIISETVERFSICNNTLYGRKCV